LRVRSRSGNEGWLTSYADLITNLLIFFVLIITASEIQSGKMEQIIEQISQNRAVESLSSAKRAVDSELEKQNLAENVSVTLTDSGLEIAFDSGVTFPSGQSTILQEMEEPLDKVLMVLKPYTDKYRVAIEGHTDEVPIRNDIYKSNWELSSARAMVIRERIEKLGVSGKMLRVEAYAEKKPLEEKLGVGIARESFLAKHRRVVVRLY
jgi:chemotaxis protein MotB